VLRSSLARALAISATLASAGCRSGGASVCATGASDGSTDAADAPRDFGAGRAVGVQSFLMSATTLDPIEGFGVRETFTLVLDREARAAYVGRFVAPLRLSGDGASIGIDPFTVGDFPSGSPRSMLRFGDALLAYDAASETLEGSAALNPRGNVAENATLFGRADATGPTLSLYPATGSVDPFLGLVYFSSKPLPPASAVRLVESPASPSLDFVPYYSTSAVGSPSFPEVPTGAVFGFGKPDVVLRYETRYQLDFGRVVDFDGHLVGNVTGGSFITPNRPPLVAFDGFEGASLGVLTGGANVVDARTFPVLSGTQCLYVSMPEDGSGSCSPAQVSLAAFRVAVPPGAKSVSFSYRTVSTFGLVTGRPSVAVGSEGGTIARADLVGMLVPHLVTLPDGSLRYLGEARTFLLAIPADAGAELIIDFEDLAAGCGLPRSPTGLLVDDLRVE
jgi:hypothetical protein